MLTTLPTRDFRAFIEQVQSTRLRAVAQHWNEARGDQLMPSFAQLRPATIAAQLPIVWVYSYDRAGGRFTGRLAGDRINQGFGKNFRGMLLEEAHPPHLFDWAQSGMARIVEERCCYRSGGQLFRKPGVSGVGERIVLPLADDGVHGDGVLGASDYDLGASLHDGPIEMLGEDECWFGLG